MLWGKCKVTECACAVTPPKLVSVYFPYSVNSYLKKKKAAVLIKSQSLPPIVQVELAARKTWITLERKQVRIRGLHHWKARAKAVKILPQYTPNRRESAIPKLNTKVYGNRKNHRFPAQNAPSFSHAVQLNWSRGQSPLRIIVNNGFFWDCCISSFVSRLA